MNARLCIKLGPSWLYSHMTFSDVFCTVPVESAQECPPPKMYVYIYVCMHVCIYICVRESFRFNVAILGLCPHEKRYSKIWHLKESLLGNVCFFVGNSTPAIPKYSKIQHFGGTPRKPKFFWHPPLKPQML